MKEYVTIYNGWMREEGDQVRRKDVGPGYYGGPSTSKPFPGCWQDCTLIGHEIFRSDLMHLEFRRPV
jgi:hypothetical protein